MKLLIVTQIVDKDDAILGFFHRWIEEFAKNCEQVIVVCLKEGVHSLPDNVRVLSLGKEKEQSKVKYLINFYKYIWRERKNYDSVFVHMNPEYVILGAPLWRAFRKKVGLWYTHGTVTLRLRLATVFANTILTASKESFRIKDRKVRVVGHGIDTAIFSYHEREVNEKPRLISIGRISRIKRQDLALGTLEALYNKGINAHLELVGSPMTGADCKYESELRAEIEGKGLEEIVEWTGSVPNGELVECLQKADFLVHTSETGSLDKVVLEAMAAGVLVVTTSKAVQTALPESYTRICTEVSAKSIAQSIAGLLTTDQIEVRRIGRKYVVDNHGLSKLIPTILGTISQ